MGTVRRFPDLFLPVGVLLGAALVLGGCHATCKQACKKLLDCDEVESSRVNLEECRASCSREEELYESWENTALEEALRDELDCITSSTCEELAAGACYDDDLYPYKDTGL